MTQFKREIHQPRVRSTRTRRLHHLGCAGQIHADPHALQDDDARAVVDLVYSACSDRGGVEDDGRLRRLAPADAAAL